MLFSSSFILILTSTVLTLGVIEGSNFKCPSSQSVYHPCKCFTWDDDESDGNRHLKISPSTLPLSLDESSPNYLNVVYSTIASLEDVKEGTTRDTEVEISCRTLETDEESLRRLFNRLNDYVTENTYTKRLSSLRVENTAISAINDDIFNGMSFASLDFFQNIDLEAFNLAAFRHSRQTLKTLLIQGSPIEGSEEFYRNLSAFVNLETLILSNNKLSGLPDEVFGRTSQANLSYIDLSGNRITKVGPKSFYKLHNLQRLSLDNNLINYIHSETFDFESSESKILLIFVRNNNLTSTSIEEGSFDSLNQTVFLYLNNNQLTYLNETVFKPLLDKKNDIFIALWNNPFSCDCRSKWLFANKMYYRKRLHGVKCVNFNKTEVWDLSDDDLSCN